MLGESLGLKTGWLALVALAQHPLGSIKILMFVDVIFRINKIRKVRDDLFLVARNI